MHPDAGALVVMWTEVSRITNNGNPRGPERPP
jgi:hypothetical protein